MKITLSFVVALLLVSPLRAEEPTSDAVKIKPKTSASTRSPRSSSGGGLQPETEVIDAPTTAVLDNYGFSSRSRFYSRGGVLQYLSFGVYPGVNLGASASVDGLIGDERHVRMRAPTAQVKWRFYEGDNELPSFAVGFDGQGYKYNTIPRRFNQRQRGFYVVATKELGAPGLQIHPSFNISDFDSNGIFGSIPLSINIKDKATILMEWDNINNWSDSRLNMGLRAHLTSNFNVDFALRAIGAGGEYSDGSTRGPERVVQLRYAHNF